MGTPFDPSILRPGDCLLYGPRGVVGFLINLKGWWHGVSHCEMYEGCIDGVHYALASRDSIGVNRYQLRTDNLAFVLRPTEPFNLDVAVEWFERVARGQRYDWTAIWRFLKPGDETSDYDPNRQICSAFLTRLYRAGGLRVFSTFEDANRVHPFQFLTSPMLDHIVWRA